MPRKGKPPNWTTEELAACLELYEQLDADETAAELYRRGLSPVLRSAGSVRQVVHHNRDAGRRVLEVVRDYRGLPLSYEDLEAELGINRKRIQALALPLVRRGLLERLNGEYGRALLRDPIAWREAAA